MKNFIKCFIIFILLFGCTVNDNYIDELIENLQKSSTESFSDEYKKLEEYTENNMNLQIAKKIISAINYNFPKREYDFFDTQEDLIRLLREYKKPDIIPYYEEIFSGVSKHAKREIIFCLTQINSPVAVKSVFNLLETTTQDNLDCLVLYGWNSNFYQSDEIFPGLLDYIEIKPYQYEILYTLYLYLSENKLRFDKIKSRLDKFLIIYYILEESINNLKIDYTKSNWVFDENYVEYRSEKALLLDIFGYFDDESITKLLEENTGSKDPRIIYFAIISLYRHKKEINPVVVNKIAADNEMRKWIFDFLDENRLRNKYPSKYFNQTDLAISDMVNWLIYPTELGSAPDHISLEKILTEKIDGFEHDFFIFKFKVDPPHWAADDGWMAGVAGPFKKDEQPTIKGSGHTFSNFAAWESKSAEEHFEDITGLVAGSNKNR